MANKKKILLVDLDHTLIDTERMKKDADTIFRRFGFSRNSVKTARKRTEKHKIFHPDILFYHITRHASKEQVGLAMRKDYFRLFIKNAQYNFSGVNKFLHGLSRRYTLILLTFGHGEFQRIKFKQSGLQRFFKDVIVTSSRRKKKDLKVFVRKHGASVAMLDDSEHVIGTAKGVGMKGFKIRKGNKDKEYYEKLLKKIRAAY